MLLVRTVSGPAQAVAGTVAIYRATSFNMSNPSPEEKQKINWVIKSDGQTVDEFNAEGDTLHFSVSPSLAGNTIQVMPFRNSPTLVVSVRTQIVSATDVVRTNNDAIVLSRSDWRARTDLPRRGFIVDPIKRTEVFIHHTVIVDDDPSPNQWETHDEVTARMHQLQTIREQDLGADVPYSMVAFCMANGDLVLGEGRGLERSGAHTRGHNTSAIGIAFQGNFENLPLPTHFDVQLAALGNWLRQRREQDGFVNLGTERPLGREVFAHRDVKPTDCPGEHLFGKLNLIRFL
jgi:hypothetical protein